MRYLVFGGRDYTQQVGAETILFVETDQERACKAAKDLVVRGHIDWFQVFDAKNKRIIRTEKHIRQPK